MYDKANFDDRQRKEIIKIFEKNDDKKVHEIAQKILKDCKINSGDAFIIKRSNKFYAMSDKTEFYINTTENIDIELKKIMPERRFDENYSNIAFYVFVIECKRDEVKNKLAGILKTFI